MDDQQLERLIAAVYRKWKAGQGKGPSTHPDEETLALFLEDKLAPAENERIKEHVVGCGRCAEIIAVQLRKAEEGHDVPQVLIGKVKNSLIQELGYYFLEVELKFKEQALEIIHTTGDVLVGQEFIPAPVLRSRSVKDFKDEVIILKDFKEVRIEIKIKNKGGNTFTVAVAAQKKDTHEVMKNVRITLIKDEVELESYVSDAGKVCFENIQVGRYSIEVTDVKEKFATVILDFTV